MEHTICRLWVLFLNLLSFDEVCCIIWKLLLQCIPVCIHSIDIVVGWMQNHISLTVCQRLGRRIITHSAKKSVYANQHTFNDELKDSRSRNRYRITVSLTKITWQPLFVILVFNFIFLAIIRAVRQIRSPPINVQPHPYRFNSVMPYSYMMVKQQDLNSG